MRYSYTLIQVFILHISWGVLLFLNGAVFYSTAIDGIVRFPFFQPYWVAAIFLIFAGCCGFVGMRIFEKHSTLSLLCMMPCQFFLLFSKLTVLNAIFSSHFADGVIRSRAFIAADQILILIVGTFYTIVLLKNYGGWVLLKRRVKIEK